MYRIVEVNPEMGKFRMASPPIRSRKKAWAMASSWTDIQIAMGEVIYYTLKKVGKK